MAKLVLSHAGSVVDQHFLDQARVTIGRDAQNAIVVDDPAIRSLHAAIVAVGKDYILEDLTGEQGVEVNGVATPRRILQHGDVIGLGAFHLRYVDTKASSEVDLERTMLIEGLASAAGPPPVALPAGTRVSTARATHANWPRGRVVWKAGARAGETRELDRVVATFGSQREGLALIARRPHGYFVCHVAGPRVPRVNGQDIGEAPRQLRDGDVLDVGDEQLQFALDAR
ncbi:MAG: FHA domain-containing protein [Burkholderiales bacterium]